MERSKQYSENPKLGAILLNLPSDKGGFEIMNRTIAVRCVEREGFLSSTFSCGIIDRVKGYLVTVDSMQASGR